MDATPAIILTRHELKLTIEEAAKQAAEFAIANLKADLRTNPREQLVHKLRQYILDPTTLQNPRDYWANGHHIRAIEISASGKPRSMAWFHQFKQKSGLAECFHRSSSQHGRLQEWTFEDIALCWSGYYAR